MNNEANSGQEPRDSYAAEYGTGARAVASHPWPRHFRVGNRIAMGHAEALTRSALFTVLEHMWFQLDAPLRLADLAAVVGMNQFRFARAFRHATGLSPHQYLVQLRVKRARELLTSSTIPVGQIALMVGFTDQSHLTNVFRRIVGTTPLRYRRSVG